MYLTSSLTCSQCRMPCRAALPSPCSSAKSSPNRRRAIPSVALDLERRGRHAEHEVGWELVFIAEMRDGQRALCVCAVAETRERQIGVRCEVGEARRSACLSGKARRDESESRDAPMTPRVSNAHADTTTSVKQTSTARTRICDRRAGHHQCPSVRCRAR